MLDSHTFDSSDPVRHLGVRLLGGFAVSVDGADIAADRWPSLRAAQLVQLLSLAPRQRLPRERVIDTLCPQLGPDADAANLGTAAHHARQALGFGGRRVALDLLPALARFGVAERDSTDPHGANGEEQRDGEERARGAQTGGRVEAL